MPSKLGRAKLCALLLASTGIYIFCNGVDSKRMQYKLLSDGTLMEAQDMESIKYHKPILSLYVGFEPFNALCYGVTSALLMLSVITEYGALALPSLCLTAGEIVFDLGDFAVSVGMIVFFIGCSPAVLFGLTYSIMLMLEIVLWLGTCSYFELTSKKYTTMYAECTSTSDDIQ